LFCLVEHDSEEISSLESWFVAYQSGDRRAADLFFQHAAERLARYFHSLGDGTYVDDQVQDALARLHAARHTYRPGEPILPWLYTLARRSRVDAFRKRFPQLKNETAVEMLPEKEVPEKTHDLESMLAPLPESQREILVLLKVEGLSLEEAARATQSTVGSVKQKVHRAYEKLRMLVDEGKWP
jgi:RNA polymerase sigma-70 factor, ECF subfamily